MGRDTNKLAVIASIDKFSIGAWVPPDLKTASSPLDSAPKKGFCSSAFEEKRREEGEEEGGGSVEEVPLEIGFHRQSKQFSVQVFCVCSVRIESVWRL